MPLVVSISCKAQDSDVLLADFLDFPTAGIEQSDDGESTRFRVHFETTAAAGGFAARFAHLDPITETIESRNWAEEWQSHWKPLAVGSRFYLAPPWSTEPTPPGRIRLPMHPGLVFGGGDHPTTQLCLTLLEEYVVPGTTVADIGSGSGILTDAAHLLNAGRLIACDTEWDAATATRAARPESLVFQGSIDAIRPGAATLIVANLLTGIIARLLPQFHHALSQGGILIASGFLADQADVVNQRAVAAGFETRESRVQGDWAASVYAARPITAGS